MSQESDRKRREEPPDLNAEDHAILDAILDEWGLAHPPAYLSRPGGDSPTSGRDRLPPEPYIPPSRR